MVRPLGKPWTAEEVREAQKDDAWVEDSLKQFDRFENQEVLKRYAEMAKEMGVEPLPPLVPAGTEELDFNLTLAQETKTGNAFIMVNVAELRELSTDAACDVLRAKLDYIKRGETHPQAAANALNIPTTLSDILVRAETDKWLEQQPRYVLSDHLHREYEDMVKQLGLKETPPIILGNEEYMAAAATQTSTYYIFANQAFVESLLNDKEHGEDKLAAALAHELGHFKKGHVDHLYRVELASKGVAIESLARGAEAEADDVIVELGKGPGFVMYMQDSLASFRGAYDALTPEQREALGNVSFEELLLQADPAHPRVDLEIVRIEAAIAAREASLPTPKVPDVRAKSAAQEKH